jgi:hypothetical protein
MALADTFDEVVGSLPDDWTDLELDLRIRDEQRYVEAAEFMVVCNAQPYSRHDWHWRILCAHRFGHAAAAPAVRTSLKLLDGAGIDGELAVRRVTSGRVEVVPTWGRPESFRQEFRRLRGQ